MKLHLLSACLAALAAAAVADAVALEAPEGAPALPAGYVPLANPKPGTIDFGAVQTGSASPSQLVMVTNSGAGPVVYTGFALSQVSPGADFAVLPQGGAGVAACAPKATLAPGASCALTVSFAAAPGSAGSGPKAAALSPQFQATAANGKGMAAGVSPGAHLAGNGVLPSGAAAPLGLSFALTAAGKDATAQSVTLSNTGIGPLRYAGAHFDSYDARFGSFSLAAVAAGGVPACNPAQPIPVGGACNLQVGYHSKLIGAATTALRIDLADGAARPAAVALSARTASAGVPRRN